jgi:pimeloyl-ACP methyl ester carboxylesterase
MRSWLIRGAVALGVAGIASAAYQVAAEARDRRQFAPPGRLAEIGGRYLHLLEAGAGSPAVVIVPAVGGNVLDWLVFHRELATDMRVCVYERAGFGWSDPPPRGQLTFGDMADELRQALAAAGIGPPYLLVGHSIGGIIARQFAERYPGDVTGIVLIDSSHEEQARLRAKRIMARRLWFALRRRARILGLRRLAVLAGFSELNAEIARDIPPEFAAMARAINLTARHRRAVVRELMLMTRSHGRPPGLGALPLTVLTAAGSDATWMQMQTELAGLSTVSTHIVAAHGGHYLQRDEPDLVASAIRDLMARVREPVGSLPRTCAGCSSLPPSVTSLVLLPTHPDALPRGHLRPHDPSGGRLLARHLAPDSRHWQRARCAVGRGLAELPGHRVQERRHRGSHLAQRCRAARPLHELVHRHLRRHLPGYRGTRAQAQHAGEQRERTSRHPDYYC